MDWSGVVVSGPMAVLSETTRNDLFADGVTREMDRDDVLVRQGERSDHVVLVLAGRFRVVVSTYGGRDVLLAVRGPGDVVGEFAAVDGAPRSATVSALEPARILQVSAERLRMTIKSEPRFMWALLEATVARLRESDRRFVGAAAETTKTNVARLLLQIAARHGVPDGDGIRLDLPLSQQELASWVGASREGVSRAIGDLRGDGFVTTSRMTTVITELDELRRVALGA